MQDISIWLIPEKKQEDSLQKTINDLATQYGTYSFVPHITPYHLENSLPLSQVITVIERVASEPHSITLDLEGIFYSEQFTKTFYARYRISPVLQSLYEKLQISFSIHPYQLVPHLSLIYKNNMKEEDKLKEKARIQIPRRLTLDRLMIITKKGGPISQEKDVLDWRVVKEIKLSP
ncbi:2'-5' RNA ligase family protein [Candidatus Roizmanbacteria bacterium]|nr:2'-5' RNA ligase family protein [Candidatus Roizmanbacteria bacterium]